MTACSSMRLFVVSRSAPKASLTFPLPTWRRMNAQPPGPGLPLQAPSVKRRTSGWSFVVIMPKRKAESGKPIEQLRLSAFRSRLFASCRMFDIDNIAVLNHVVFGLLPHQAGSFDLALAAEADNVGDAHRFGADEPASQVRVNAAGGFEGGAALSQ